MFGSSAKSGTGQYTRDRKEWLSKNDPSTLEREKKMAYERRKVRKQAESEGTSIPRKEPSTRSRADFSIPWGSQAEQALAQGQRTAPSTYAQATSSSHYDPYNPPHLTVRHESGGSARQTSRPPSSHSAHQSGSRPPSRQEFPAMVMYHEGASRQPRPPSRQEFPEITVPHENQPQYRESSHSGSSRHSSPGHGGHSSHGGGGHGGRYR